MGSVLLDNSTHGNTSDHHNSTDHDHHHEKHFEPTIIVFMFGGMIIGALIRTFLKRFALPYTVWLFLFGAILGVLSSQLTDVAKYTTMARLDPHIIIIIFLPIIIFESAFCMEVHTFIKAIGQIAILASLGLGLSTIMTAVFAMNVFHYNWGWGISLTFGSMISATDPVAIVCLMREIGADDRLMTLIEGESLMNDGAAIILFNIFRDMAKGENLSAVGMVLYLLKVLFGGTLLGFCIAKLTLFWLVNVFNDALTEITITLAATYVTFYLGEVTLRISGVLAVVVLGLTINADRTSISPEVETFLHRFWEMLAYLSNTLIFILVGVVIVERSIKNIDTSDLILILALYGALSFIRATTVLLLSPILRKFGYGFPWTWAAVLTWGGLRGAVSLMLALLLIRTPIIDPSGTAQDKVLIHTSGTVLLTLLVNGTTCRLVLHYLGLSDISGPKKQAMAHAVRTLNAVAETKMESYKTDGFLADAEWPFVIKCVHMTDPYTSDQNHDGEDCEDFIDKCSKCPKCETDVPNELSNKELFELKEEARLRLLKALKTSYMSQFEHGVLSRMAVRRLVECVETASDQVDGMIEVKDIKKTWQIPRIYQWMTRKLQQWESSKEERVTIVRPKHKLRRVAFIVCEHYSFTIFINLIILINAVAIITEYVIESQICGPKLELYEKIFRAVNYGFLVIYTFEAVIKIIAHLLMYFKSKWNLFDFIILIFSFVDLIVDLSVFAGVLSTCAGEEQTGVHFQFSPSVFRIAKAIRFLRIVRSLRLVKGLIPHLQKMVHGRINTQLRFGYDVGKGYVVGQQEVSHFVELIVDNKEISNDFKTRVDLGKTEIIKALGIIQKEHPGIAVSVKTQQASRQILNVLREKILELRSEGALDESEADKLDMAVEVKMKKLLGLPKTIPPSSPERVISNLMWAAGDPVLIQYLKVNAELYSMVEGEVLQDAETPEGGLYIIVSGLVRVEGAIMDNTNYEYMKSNGDLHAFSMTTEALSQWQPPKTESDFFTTGNVIGEFSLLTGCPMNVEVTCETSAQLYHISYEAIKAALELLTDKPSLEYRMWKVIGKRLGTQILGRQLMYRSWTTDALKQHMDKAEILIHKFDTDKEARVVEITAVHVSDVILLHGEALLEATEQLVQGPCYIPPVIESHLELLGTKTDKHILLVILRSTENVLPGSNIVVSLESDASRPSVLALHAHKKTKHTMHAGRRTSQLSVLSNSLIPKRSVVSAVFEIITDRSDPNEHGHDHHAHHKHSHRRHSVRKPSLRTSLLNRHNSIKPHEEASDASKSNSDETKNESILLVPVPPAQVTETDTEQTFPANVQTTRLSSVMEADETSMDTSEDTTQPVSVTHDPNSSQPKERDSGTNLSEEPYKGLPPVDS